MRWLQTAGGEHVLTVRLTRVVSRTERRILIDRSERAVNDDRLRYRRFSDQEIARSRNAYLTTCAEQNLVFPGAEVSLPTRCRL